MRFRGGVLPVSLIAMECEQTPADCRGCDNMELCYRGCPNKGAWLAILELLPGSQGPVAEVSGAAARAFSLHGY